MASAFSHAFFAVAAGKAYSIEPRPWRFWIASAACSILPDADVIGFAFGIDYEDFMGHRGFTHSILFAFMLGAAVPWILERKWSTPDWLYFSFVTASHGVFDAMTNGGLGVAFFSPFDTTRYFFPWTPIQVSPIGVSSFFSRWGFDVLLTEITFIWIPSALLAWLVRWKRRPKPA